MGIVAMFATAGCGGESTAKPPASPPPATPSASAPTPSDEPAPASGKKIDGPAAPTSSDDVNKGISALKAGDMNGAKAAFEVAVQKNPKQADAYHYLGLVNDQTGQKADAEKNYRKALELKPDLDESATNLAAILIEAGKYDEAAGLMKKAIAKNPKSAALQVNLGMALSGKNDVDGANKAFEEAIKLEPNNGIHVVTYAGHLARNSKKDEAITKLKQAEKISANDAGVLASVALEYKGMKDFKTCIAVLDKAVHVKDVAELRIYRGTCKLGLKDLSGATTEFKDAVAKEPNNALAHYSLGNALADGGKLPEAISEWETYLKLAPEGPQAKAAEKKIGIAKAKAGGKK
ncbi:MAG TPA: tetratricopeptide repeat protein [Labilithrix sp.]|nr:tetratricopeptide repeat protein [Labilithrix sp.]